MKLVRVEGFNDQPVFINADKILTIVDETGWDYQGMGPITRIELNDDKVVHVPGQAWQIATVIDGQLHPSDEDEEVEQPTGPWSNEATWTKQEVLKLVDHVLEQLPSDVASKWMDNISHAIRGYAAKKYFQSDGDKTPWGFG